MSKGIVLAAIAVACLALGVHAAVDSSKFQFRTSFKGEWEVETRTFAVADLDAADAVPPEANLATYSLSAPEGSDDLLVGSYRENATDTTETLIELDLRVSFDDPNIGVFQTRRTSEGEEEGEFKTLFQFDFALENEMLISRGKYHTRSAGAYQFVMTTPNRFILTVFPLNPNAKDAQTTTIIGNKRQKSQSFFEKYGMTMVFVALFVGSKLLQAKAGPSAPQGAAPAAAAAKQD